MLLISGLNKLGYQQPSVMRFKFLITPHPHPLIHWLELGHGVGSKKIGLTLQVRDLGVHQAVVHVEGNLPFPSLIGLVHYPEQTQKCHMHIHVILFKPYGVSSIFTFAKHCGFFDFPTTQSGSFLVPSILAQTIAVTHSLLCFSSIHIFLLNIKEGSSKRR